MVAQVGGLAIRVIHLKLELLHTLKVELHVELLDKPRVAVISNKQKGRRVETPLLSAGHDERRSEGSQKNPLVVLDGLSPSNLAVLLADWLQLVDDNEGIALVKMMKRRRRVNGGHEDPEEGKKLNFFF